MATTYTQTDTSATFDVACGVSSAGITTVARNASTSGSAGSTEATGDPGNNVTRVCFAFDCTPAPNLDPWPAGTWTVNINHSTMDGGTILTRVDICEYDVPFSQWFTVASNTSPGHSRGGLGTIAVNVTQGSDYSLSGDQSTSRPYIVLEYNNNDLHGTSSFGITPSLTIVAPYGGSSGNPHRLLLGVG